MFSGKLQGTHFRGPLCDFSFSQIYSIDFGEIHQVEINHKYALIQKQIKVWKNCYAMATINFMVSL